MTLKTMLTVGAATVAMTVAVTAGAHAKTLRVQTSFNAGDLSLQYLEDKWLPKLTEMTGGDVELELLPTKAVVPHKETPDAVAAGVLDGDFTATAYFTGRDPAFALMGDLVAGYDTPEQHQKFCKEAGAKVLQEAFDRILPGKIHVVACGPYSREALVAAQPIEGMEDLKGIKIRAPEGLASEVFRRAGATPVNIPFSEVYTSIEKGIVNAADASAYVNNDAIGMHEIAKYPLYPGIHSQASQQFTINQRTWESLDAEDQQALTDWFYMAYADLAKAMRAKDEALVARDKDDPEITVINWSQEDRDAFRAVAAEAWKDFASKSEMAQKAYDAHIGFMKKEGMLK